MKPTMVTTRIWPEITKAAKSGKNKSFVAVAYFGNRGASLLPLKKGDILVVDASDGAVVSGQTSPSELIKLYQKGVTLYSYPQLHAKVFAVNNTLYLGSANVSNNSANNLQEAVIKLSDKEIVKQAREFIKSLCISELAINRLKELKKKYRPPRIPGGKKSNVKRKSFDRQKPEFYVVKLGYIVYEPGHEVHLAQGLKEAKKKKSKKPRHYIQDFQWNGKIPFKEGDTILQITNESTRKMVSPPGTVLSIKRWKNNKYAFVFLEMPDKPAKSASNVSRIVGKGVLNRSGKKNNIIASKIHDLWN